MLSNIPYLLGMLFLLFIPFGRHCLAGEDATVPNTEELAFEPIPDAETKMDLVAVSGAIKRVDHSQLWGIKPLTPIEQTLTESEVALFRRLWVMVALMEKPIALKQHDLVLFARALNILVEMEPAKRSVNIKMARFMQWIREEQCTMDVSTATQMDEIEGESPLQNDKNAHVDLHILSKILGLQPSDHAIEGMGSHGMNNGKILVFNMQPKNNGNEVAEKANMADPSKVDKEGNEMAQQNISEPVPEPFIEVPHNVVLSAPLEQMPANYPMGMAQPAPMRSTSDDAIVAADSAESNGGGGLLGFLSKLFLLKRRKRQIPLSALEQAFGGDGAQIHIVGEQEDPLALLAERIQKAQEQKAPEREQQTAATNAQMAKLLEQIIEKSFASKFNVPSSQDGKDDENSKTVESEQCDKNAAPRNPLKEIVVPKAKKSADIVMMDEEQAEMDSKNIIEMLTKALNAHKMSGKIVDENRKGSEGIVEKTHSEPFLASSQTAMEPQIQTADDENSGNPAKENSAENQAENAENPKCQKLNAIRDYLLEFVHQTKGDIGKTKIDERLAYIWLSELQYWLARHAQREFNAPNVSVQQLLGNEVKALDFLQRFANIWHTKLQFALPKRVREDFDAATQGVNPVMEKAGKRLDFLREQWEQTDKQLTELKEWIGKDYKK